VAPYPFYPDPVAPTAAPEQELASLKQQAQYFQEAVDEINKRIEELEKAQQEE
jgi:prefoldin subunit 5